MHQASKCAMRSPFAAKLGIGQREAPPGPGVELSRNTSLRHYGAFKQSDAADVADRQLWSAVRSIDERIAC